MTRLRKQVSTGDAFRQLGLRYRAQISEHEAGAMRRDAESLHKMRVGVRRLRSLFTTFKGALVAEEVRDLRRDLRWLQRILGDCRDWDVFNAENVLPLRERLAEDDRLQRFAELGAQARERVYDKLEQVAGTKRYRAVYQRLDAALNNPKAVGTRQMRRPVALRKQIKKARYAIEFFSDLYREKRTKHHLAQLSLLQDLAGHMVDVRAGQALIDELQPRKGPDRKVLDAAHDMVTGWMMAKSAGCRERLEVAWARYRPLKRLG
jgi:triphosphatase